MWEEIFKFLARRYEQAPRQKLVRALTTLFASMQACHRQFAEFKPAAGRAFQAWSERPADADDHDHWLQYWNLLDSEAKLWTEALVNVATHLDELRLTLDVTDPDLLMAIDRYVAGECEAVYAADKRAASHGARWIAGALGRAIDRANVYDPESCRRLLNEGGASFDEALELLRNFMLNTLELSAQDVYGAH
jgi:hypothetical protein